MSLTDEQKSCLRQLAKKKAKALEQTRQEINTMIVKARDMGISSRAIAEAIGLTQPRIIQLTREAKGGDCAPLHR